MRGLRVLIADDNPDHQMLLGLAMSSAEPFVEPTFADDAESIVRETEERGPFDCLGLHYRLGERTADEAIATCNGPLAGMPVVVISSSADQRAVIESPRGGAADFVPKADALHKGTLLTRMKHALARRRRGSAWPPERASKRGVTASRTVWW